MKTSRCKTCENFNQFFCSCNLYYKEVYLDEGDFDIRPVPISSIKKNECNYVYKQNKAKDGNNE